MTTIHCTSWSRLIGRTFFAAALCGVFAVQASFFTVPDGYAAVVTRFGNPVREIVEPGAYWKFPVPIDELRLIDRRDELFVTPNNSVLTRDKKNVILTTYVVWNVADPLRFLQSCGTTDAARTNLAGMIAAAKNRTLGGMDLNQLVSLRRADIRLDELEADILGEVATSAEERLGLRIERVGVERIALPEENLAAVFQRMKAERLAEANRLRAQGAKDAQAIRDDAHIKSQEILRRGREEAGAIFAEAERRAGELLADAHSRDPDFYRFWSALQATKEALKERATLVLRTDQLFFDGLVAKPAEPGTKSRRSESSSDVLGTQAGAER